MLRIRNIEKTFNKGTENELHIFDDFNLEIKDGSITALLGANGCGKSTLLNLISGSMDVDAGEIELGDVKLSSLKEHERAPYIAKVHQNPTAGVSPSLTILENMSLADKKGSKFSLKKLVITRIAVGKRQYQIFAVIGNSIFLKLCFTEIGLGFSARVF